MRAEAHTRHERPCHRVSSADFFNDIGESRPLLLSFAEATRAELRPRAEAETEALADLVPAAGKSSP